MKHLPKTILCTLFLLLLLGSLKGQQSNELTEKFFRDPEAIAFNTPSLMADDSSFASYESILAWINQRVNGSPNVRLDFIGTTTGGYKIPILYFSNGIDCNKVRVWFQGGLHGNEPAGVEGLFMLTDYILNTNDGKKLLDKVNVAILPIANVDGYLSQKRVSADGYDLNRDQSKFADPVSPTIKKAYIDWNPHVAVDFHEFSPSKKEFSNLIGSTATLYYDVLFLPSGYPNIPATLRNASVNMVQKECEKALNKFSYTHNFYFTVQNTNGEPTLIKGAQNPQSSSTSYALSNAISMLVEIRGIGLGKTSFKRRTHSGFIVAKTVMELANCKANEIIAITKEAAERTIALTDNVAVTANAKSTRLPVKLIDVDRNEVVEKEFAVKDALEMTPTLVRKRPLAYILDECMEQEVERLRVLGVKIDQLDKEQEYTVESYKVETYTESDKVWEKIKTVKVTAAVTTSKKKFKKGAYYINLAQKNANYAISLLEPESPNGFVSFRVSEAKQGDILNVYRIINY